jgi:hypothetical protein
MKPELPIPDRLKAGSPGLGEAASTDIERRAIELAIIDGRDAFTDTDLRRAAAELGGGPAEPIAPEVDEPVIEKVSEWDEPVDQSGALVERAALDDEVSLPEQLIQEGIDEADHDRRVAAAEEVEEEQSES